MFLCYIRKTIVYIKYSFNFQMASLKARCKMTSGVVEEESEVLQSSLFMGNLKLGAGQS